MTKAYEKIAAGLGDAITFAEGDTSKGRVASGQPAPRGVAADPSPVLNLSGEALCQPPKS